VFTTTYVERQKFDGERFQTKIHLIIGDIQLHFWNKNVAAAG